MRATVAALAGALGCLVVTAGSSGLAIEPITKVLSAKKADGYARFATDAFGGFRSSECGGGFDANGVVKPSGAAEFDPWNSVTNRGEGGLTCVAYLSLFQDHSYRLVLNTGGVGWSGSATVYPDGSPLTPGLTADDLLSDEQIGPDDRIRRTRFTLPGLPGVVVTLDQSAACATLTRVYRFTNTSDAPVTLRIVEYADSDLGFGGNFTQDFGWLDPGDPFATGVYNRFKDVGVIMRAHIDPTQQFEGYRTKLQGSAAYDILRMHMYYGFPNPLHPLRDCDTNEALDCPPSLLNGLFRSVNGGNNNNYYIPPDGGASYENTLTPDASGFSPSSWDVGHGLQASYTLAPGESREWRSTYEGVPAYCRISADANFDQAVATSVVDGCTATVTLDATRSVLSGDPASYTYTWRDLGSGVDLGEGAQLAVTVLGAGHHEISLEVCNADGDCDADVTQVDVTSPDPACDVAPSCVGGAGAASDLVTAWVFTSDDDDVIVAVSATPEPPPLPSGTWLRYPVRFFGALSDLPAVGADLAAFGEAGAHCALLGAPDRVRYDAPLPCEPGAVNAFDLAGAAGLSALVCGDYEGLRDVARGVAVAGTLTPADGFSIGLALAGGPEPAAAVMIGEALVARFGTIHGDVVHGVDDDGAGVSLTDVTLADEGEVRLGTPVELPFACRDAEDTARYLAGAAPTADADVAWWGQVELVGTEAGTNVFAVDAADLAPPASVHIAAPAGSTVVVLVSGAAVALGRGEVVVEGVSPDHVLFDLFEATAVEMSALRVVGTVLAPFADVAWTAGDLHGTLIARSAVGDVEIREDGAWAGVAAVVTSCDGAVPDGLEPVPDPALGDVDASYPTGSR
ncbi:MAG: choice-of-anchor A family protein [Deltaproteobacteria bacterium]|nr:choice-of-anchor A family protein [Deltaproteobacteria bacterium]